MKLHFLELWRKVFNEEKSEEQVHTRFHPNTNQQANQQLNSQMTVTDWCKNCVQPLLAQPLVLVSAHYLLMMTTMV